jgi:hypothetical protein
VGTADEFLAINPEISVYLKIADVDSSGLGEVVHSLNPCIVDEAIHGAELLGPPLSWRDQAPIGR